MTETDRAVAHADVVMERVRGHGAHVSRRVSRAARRAVRATKIGMGSAAAILVAAFAWALLIGPIGITGIMLVFVAMMAAMCLAILFSREPDVAPAELKQVALTALPDRTARWLDGHRLALPAPAQTLADGIGVKLHALAPQLASLDEREPAAQAIRRLIGDELPELVSGYERVPQNLRRQSLDGLAPDRQLIDGLKTVDSELDRMCQEIARGDMTRLATQGKYLELKYSGDPTA